jgi:hypothetical protein
MSSNQPGWWSRNWKWAAPSGCLLVVLLAFAGCAGIVATIFGAMKSNEAYTGALSRAQSSSAVIAALGEPVEAGWMVSGEWNENGASGDAKLSIPLTGPRGAGTLFLEAEKSAGRWDYSVLTFVPASGGETVDLLAEDGE